MFSINIRGNIFSIDNDKISYKGKSLNVKDIDKFLSNESTLNPAVWYGDKYGNEIRVKFSHFFNISSTPLENYRKVATANHSIVVPSILQKISDSFSRGESVAIGDCTINKEGIFYTKTTFLLSKINSFLRWQDVGIYKDGFEIFIRDEKNKSFIKAFDMKKTWNSILLQGIQNTVLNRKPVLPPSPRVM